jgi:predicted transcriptional regulator
MRSHHHELPFAYGHRDALQVLAAILRRGGKADMRYLTQVLRMPVSTASRACAVLAADGFLSVRLETGRMVYATTGAQMSKLLDKLSESYAWRIACVDQKDSDTELKHG